MPIVSLPLESELIGSTVKSLMSYETFLLEELRKVKVIKKSIREMCDHSIAKDCSCPCGHTWSSGDPF